MLHIDQGSDDKSDESCVDKEETAFGDLLVQRAYDRYDDMYQAKIEECMEEMEEVHAEKKVYDLLWTKYKKYLIKEYRFFLLTMYLMQKSPVQRQIKGIINRYVEDGYNYDHATDRALKDNKYLFNAILDKFHTDIESEDSGSDNKPEEG